MQTFIQLKPGQNIKVALSDWHSCRETIMTEFRNPEYVLSDDGSELVKNTKSMYLRPVEQIFLLSLPAPLLVDTNQPVVCSPGLSIVASQEKPSKYKVSVSENWTDQERFGVIAALTLGIVAANALSRVYAVASSSAQSLQERRDWIMGEELEDVLLAA